MTKFVATYDRNGGERKARVQGARWGDGGCTRGSGYGRGRGGGEGGDDPLSGVGGVGPGGQKWLWLAGWAGPGVVGLAGASDYY
jgi:hypothetical protein